MAYIKNPTAKQRMEWNKNKLDREAEVKNMILNIAEKYEENPDNIAEFLEFGSKFYRYSVKNNLLVYAQNPYANFVQSYGAWKKAGYAVKAKEKGLKVYVPVKATKLKVGDKLVALEQATKEEKTQYKAGEIEAVVETHFAVGTVFDISQTTFPKEQYPKLFQIGYQSSHHAALVKGLTSYAEKKLNCKVNVKELQSISLRGNFIPAKNEINLNAILEDTEKLSTLTHEIGHAMMQHQPGVETVRSEFEGDAIGIMLASHFGVEVTESRRRHCAEQYRLYQQEMAEKEEKTDILQILEQVYKIYRRNMPEIQKEVEPYLESVTVNQTKAEERKETKPQKRKLTKSEIYDEIKRQISIVDYAQRMGYTIEQKGRYYSLKEHDSVRIDPERNCFWRNSGIGKNTSGSIIDFAAEFRHDGDLHNTLVELTAMIDTSVAYGLREISKPDPVRNTVTDKMKLLYGEVFKEYHLLKNKLQEQELQAGNAMDRMNLYVSALDKLENGIKEKKEISFTEEEQENLKLLGERVTNYLKQVMEPKVEIKNELVLPDKAPNMKRVYAYLLKTRYLDQDVVQDLVDHKMLYQDTRGNCVFVSRDEKNDPVFACLRGTLTGSTFKGDVRNSDYTRGFYIDNQADKLIAAESVIDALSIMTILKGQGHDYKEYDYSVLAGTGKYESLVNQLQENPKKEILLAVDNDKAGIAATDKIIKLLAENNLEGKISLHIPKSKDWNQDLVNVASKFKSLELIPFLEESPWPKEVGQNVTQEAQGGWPGSENVDDQTRVPAETKGNVTVKDENDYAAHTEELQIKRFELKDSFIMVEVDHKGIESTELLWQVENQYFITTGMEVDHTYQKHVLSEAQVKKYFEFKETLGSQVQETSLNGMIQMQEYSTGSEILKDTIRPGNRNDGKEIKDMSYVKRIQQQELQKNRLMHTAPVLKPEIEL